MISYHDELMQIAEAAINSECYSTNDSRPINKIQNGAIKKRFGRMNAFN